MNRRIFIKLSAGSLLPIIGGGCDFHSESGFTVHIMSDMNFGHQVFEGNQYKDGPEMQTEILIVGGGIAGMAAAWQLRDKDILLCELSGRLGGTSTALSMDGISIAQGAHYDLAYPGKYGKDALRMLQDLDIIEYNSFSHLWEFREKKYTIQPGIEGQCYANGRYREDVLPEGRIKRQFIDLINSFADEMVMPTRLIKQDYHYLDSISFINYLKDRIDMDPAFIEGLDYNMRDDYGGDSSTVSALAGIHYYMCRPYYKQPVELFSPPQGNYYFISRMASDIDERKLKTGCLVYKINPLKNGFLVNVLNKNRKERLRIKTEKIIYAGNKHVLKYSLPSDYHLFDSVQYAPWAVMNIILKKDLAGDIFWQNEIISAHPSLIGFVDSGSQHTPENIPRILTVYFCLDPDNRSILESIEEQKMTFTYQAISPISEYFGQDVSGAVDKVYLRIFGHAMPVPKPGYLFKDENKNRSHEHLVYAGVDNHRLPLFFEALDSGILAASMTG